MAALRSYFHKIYRSLKGRGVSNTVAIIAEVVHESIVDIDRRYGTDTGGIISLAKLQGIEDEEREGNYQGCDPRVFARVFRDLPVELSDYVFLDLGSGKGRALLLASRFDFKRIIGVEISSELNEIAERNIALYERIRRGRGTHIELVCGDAGNYRLPDSDLVVYLYNPFHSDVLIKVLENIERLAVSSRRDVIVVYHNPVFQELLDNSGFLERIGLQRYHSSFTKVPIGFVATYRVSTE